ncbi:MAG: leucyl aminopeptidase family protein [Bacteroidetes bacterium]|nr:MAG: leucyl aminopeptidase family protein [Bacteroidota bacterium]
MIVKVVDKKAPDALIVPLAQDETLANQLAQIAQRAGIDPQGLQTDFKAETKEVFVLYGSGKPGYKFYLIGLGRTAKFEDMYANIRAFCARYKSRLPNKVGVDLRHFPAAHPVRLTDAAVSGMLLGLYNIGLFRTEPAPQLTFGTAQSELHILVPGNVLEPATSAARRGEVFAGVLRQVLDLVNTPGNYKNPDILIDWALRTARESGIKIRLLDAATLQMEGLEALLAVGKGSPHPPGMLLLEYGTKSRKNPAPVFGLVGKGITFDTGGISIKPSASMQYMKSDMGGAAAVLGTFLAAARLQLPVRLVGAIPIAENMVDGIAIKPGDVIGSYSGKTIEVIDTDAEGRLILADGLAYLNKLEKPDVLIDIATLTGSVIRTLGIAAGGLFTQNDALSEALSRAGEGCGERLWRLPMWDVYAADLKSDVADLRNFTGKPMAEAISAAKFIEFFTDKHPTWAHLDVAGMAFGDTEFGKAKNATGYGVRLLVEFIEQWQEKR